jgi:hypothetical protein
LRMPVRTLPMFLIDVKRVSFCEKHRRNK